MLLMAKAEDMNMTSPADRQQGQPRPRRPALHAGPVAAPAVEGRLPHARRPGVPAAVLRPHLALQPDRAPDLAVRHRLRGHRHREPVSVEHRHLPLREAAGRHRRLRAPLLRRRRPARDQPGHRQGLPGGRRARGAQLPRAVVAERRRRAADGVVPRAQQRLPGAGHRRRGLDLEPAPGRAGRRLARLLPDRRPAVHLAVVDEGAAGRARLRHQRAAARVQRQRRRHGRGGDGARRRRPA